MPVGAQLAKQAASSYQQSLLPGGAQPSGSGAMGGPLPAPVTGLPAPVQGPAGGKSPKGPVGTAPIGTAPIGGPVATQGVADPTKGYNIFAGMDPQQIQLMNQNMGISNLFKGKSPEEPKSILLMSEDGTEEVETKYDKTVEGIEKAAAELQATPFADDEESPFAAKDYTIGSDVPDVGEAAGSEVGTFGVDLEGLASEGPGTVSSYEGVDDDLGGKNIDEIEDAINDWYLESQGDTIGLDPEKKAEAMNQLDQKYAIFLQQTLAGLDRQAAMAGTFGSAAHTMNINTAVSGALQQMASEFMDLEKMDLAAVEEDYAEIFGQMQGLSEQYTNMENLGMQLEGLNQAAYKMGLDQFAAEIQAYLATGEMGSKALQQYQKEIDQLISIGALDLEAWKAGLSKEEAEAQLGLASENLALEYEKIILESSSLFSEKTAGEVATVVDWIKENYSGSEAVFYLSGIMSLFAISQSEIAEGKDYDSVMEEWYKGFALFLASMNY